MALPPALARIVHWLRAGYPEGVPEHDYMPLFTVLRHQLTDDEVTLIAADLAFSADPESAAEIKRAATAITRTDVSDVDITRVRSRLAAGGWPLAPPESLEPAKAVPLPRQVKLRRHFRAVCVPQQQFRL